MRKPCRPIEALRIAEFDQTRSCDSASALPSTVAVISASSLSWKKSNDGEILAPARGPPSLSTIDFASTDRGPDFGGGPIGGQLRSVEALQRSTV